MLFSRIFYQRFLKVHFWRIRYSFWNIKFNNPFLILQTLKMKLKHLQYTLFTIICTLENSYFIQQEIVTNPFHVTGFFLYPLKIQKTCRRYGKRWNGFRLKILLKQFFFLHKKVLISVNTWGEGQWCFYFSKHKRFLA